MIKRANNTNVQQALYSCSLPQLYAEAGRDVLKKLRFLES